MSNAGSPWGISQKQLLDTQSVLNTSFSQRAWANAELDGCLSKPCGKLPDWPPPRADGFIYPTADKETQYVQGVGSAVSGFQEPFSTCSSFQGRNSATGNNETGSTVRYDPPQLDAHSATVAQGIVEKLRRENMRRPHNQRVKDNDKKKKTAHYENINRGGWEGGEREGWEWMNSNNDNSIGNNNASENDENNSDPHCTLKTVSAKTFLDCTADSVGQFFYDLTHWKDLPDPKMKHIFPKSRIFFLLSALVIILTVLLLLKKLFKRKTPLKLK